MSYGDIYIYIPIIYSYIPHDMLISPVFFLPRLCPIRSALSRDCEPPLWLGPLGEGDSIEDVAFWIMIVGLLIEKNRSFG